ncbi:probable ADP-ribosylation factor-like protein 1 [Hanseniaspora guilliermondii]|uniref:Probable ADP-ribosylation factor-like protein 1 n=1 Tax=Hanseniaspora guilliermondii TaxID=56406 RepID=A0A1L0B7E1_9ASCO|nr:probable ADP-ribosylation factor-like protein 1 [Hanseniaspora guilliermondii]
MGQLFSSMFDKLFNINKDFRILILGLDGAGKTSILYRLQIGDIITTKPTIGFNVETINYKNIKLNVWDLGGQTSIRPYWRCYYTNTQGIIFVIDSTDTERLNIASTELRTMLQEEELKDACLLVLCNKQDLQTAQSIDKINEALQLYDLKDRNWSILGCSAKTGDGITEGLDWLIDVVKENNVE